MCKISINTVRRANDRTRMQISKTNVEATDKSFNGDFGLSFSFMGRTFGKSLSAAQIHNSFNKALNYAEKV